MVPLSFDPPLCTECAEYNQSTHCENCRGLGGHLNQQAMARPERWLGRTSSRWLICRVCRGSGQLRHECSRPLCRLLAAVNDAPHDATRRLVLADALDKIDCNEEARNLRLWCAMREVMLALDDDVPRRAWADVAESVPFDADALAAEEQYHAGLSCSASGLRSTCSAAVPCAACRQITASRARIERLRCTRSLHRRAEFVRLQLEAAAWRDYPPNHQHANGVEHCVRCVHHERLRYLYTRTDQLWLENAIDWLPRCLFPAIDAAQYGTREHYARSVAQLSRGAASRGFLSAVVCRWGEWVSAISRLVPDTETDSTADEACRVFTGEEHPITRLTLLTSPPATAQLRRGPAAGGYQLYMRLADIERPIPDLASRAEQFEAWIKAVWPQLRTVIVR